MRNLTVHLWGISLVLIIIGLVYTLSDIKGPHTVDARTKDLCMEYAMRDHSMEIGLARFKELKKLGDPNDYQFFYNSCLNHIKCPTANDCYIDNKYMEGK